MFKVSTSEILTKFIDEFRESHPTWPIEVPFILQRLGLQYKSRKSSKRAENSSKSVQNGKKIELVKEERKNAEENAEKNISEKILDQIESKNDENVVEKPSMVSKKLKKNTKKVEKFKKTTTKPKEETILETKIGENFIEKPSKNAQTLKTIKKPKKIGKIGKISEKLPNNEIISTETSAMKQSGRFGQMELRRLNLNEISTDEFLPSSSSTVDLNRLEREPKTRSSKPIAGEFDPFFVKDDGEVKSGSFRTAPHQKDDPIDDDSGNNSDRGGDRKKSLQSQFGQSLSGKNESKAKFRSKNDRK